MERTCPHCKAPVDSFLFSCSKCGARVTAGLDIHGLKTEGKADGERSLDDEFRRMLENPSSLPPAVSEPSAQDRAKVTKKRRWRRGK